MLPDCSVKTMTQESGLNLEGVSESVTASGDNREIDVITFKGINKSPDSNQADSSQGSGSFLDGRQRFEYDSSSESLASFSIQKKGLRLPRGLVAVINGSPVDVTSPYPFDWEHRPSMEFQNPPTPEQMRNNPSGVKRVEYTMLYILSQNEHPGVLARFLLSGAPLDYNFWMNRRIRKQLRVDFEYKGEDYSFNTVPAVQVAMQGLIDVVIDPGFLLHGLYQANVVQVQLLGQSLKESVAEETVTKDRASKIMNRENGLRADLEQELLMYAGESVKVYITDRTLGPR